ncbi:hypothetical protein LINGRAHAP2_LOCUS36968 [Linum grandiflorum]
MPPSPGLRFSPGREVKGAAGGGGDGHKRGRSFEGGILFKEKDDDLALFNEMQTREKEDFLLQSADDFEDSFSTKLRYFSDLKLGISVAGRGECSGMLNAEGEKNDYDWLITPPDTPLFPSLDDEPVPASLPARGRPRSQPISISRSSTMEKSYRSSRGSASPNRSSPSPRSGSSTLQSRGRPSSTRNSSPTPSQRPATPSRRPSTPPHRPSTPQHRPSTPPSKASSSAPRSSTPTPRRASTGSGQRGVSPVRSSVSPKVKAWQSTIPGFSSEAPPNLRTSLGDRPVSYVRGSSPASRNGRDSSSKSGRQSMSPIASRSASSSHSQDRDRVSSYSKGSVASSGDDDVDSVQSVHVGSLDRSKRLGGFSSNKASAMAKKPARVFSPSSAPKRSFDSAIRQMDHRKSPQNMFRPLLSSVPSTTFYAGKGSSVQRSLVSMTSSVTTSSNASSDQGASFAPDTDGNDHHHDTTAIETRYNSVQEDIFAFDKADDLNEDTIVDVEPQSHLQAIDRDSLVKTELGDSEEFSQQDLGVEEVSSASDAMFVRNDFSEVDSLKICSGCGCKYRDVEATDHNTDINLCEDCSKQDSALETVTAENSLQLSVSKAEESKQIDESKIITDAPEMQSQIDNVVYVSDVGKQVNASSHEGPQEESVAMSAENGNEQKTTDEQGFTEPALVRSVSDLVTGTLQMPNYNEGAGISVVLRKSSSIKGHVFQGRSFTASSVSYDDVSFTRDSANSFRSSMGHGSTSGSSSVDLYSARIHRQLSGSKKGDHLDSTRPLSRGSSFSGSVNLGHQVVGLGTGTVEARALGDVSCAKRDDEVGESVVDGLKMSTSAGPVIISDEYICERSDSSRTMDASSSVGMQLEEQHSVLPPTSNEEAYQDDAVNLPDTDASSPLESSLEAKNKVSNTSIDQNHTSEVPSHSRLASISEIEAEDRRPSHQRTESNGLSENLGIMADGIEDTSVSAPSDKDATAPILENNTSGRERGVLDESTVTVECPSGNKARSLTLEEATDTILFCSSIVHDLAYRAATIAIEKELSVPPDDSRPTVTILGKSTPDRKESRGRNKRASKSSKVKQQKQLESAAKSPTAAKVENDENDDSNANEDLTMRNVGLDDSNKMDSSKPPKLESKCNCTIM